MVQNKAVYLAIGVTCAGYKQVLGLWMKQTEGARFWLSVMNELRTRGLQDVLAVARVPFGLLEPAPHRVRQDLELPRDLRHRLPAGLHQLHDLFPEFLRIGLVSCLFVRCLSAPSTHQFSSMLPCSSHATSSVHEMGVTPKSLPGAADLLRFGLSFEQLDAEAYACSDNEAVAQLYAALEALFLEIPYERMAVA